VLVPVVPLALPPVVVAPPVDVPPVEDPEALPAADVVVPVWVPLVPDPPVEPWVAPGVQPRASGIRTNPMNVGLMFARNVRG
jgi:hypothetical protein